MVYGHSQCCLCFRRKSAHANHIAKLSVYGGLKKEVCGLQCNIYIIVIYDTAPKFQSLHPNFSVNEFIRIIIFIVCIFQILKYISKCDHKKDFDVCTCKSPVYVVYVCLLGSYVLNDSRPMFIHRLIIAQVLKMSRTPYVCVCIIGDSPFHFFVLSVFLVLIPFLVCTI
jgi:hypothetical protein